MNHRNRNLKQLLQGFPLVNVLGPLDRDVSQIVFDSRNVQPGDVFVAIPGFKEDGTRFIVDALKKGASAFVTSTPLEQLDAPLGTHPATAVRVDDCRSALAWLSKEYFGNPSKDLRLVGITGTNGKTTLTFLLEHIFKVQGMASGVLGSINYRYGDSVIPASMTTPEAIDINRHLSEMIRHGIGQCFMEVSSHALALKRVEGLEFAVAGFTNLSRDHLDFHETFDDYKNAKKRLFEDHRVRQSVLNIDDPFARELAGELSLQRLTVALERSADVVAEDSRCTDTGCEFTLKTPYGSQRVKSRLLGRHNIYNLAQSAAMALLLDVPLDAVVAGLESANPVPGRFEQVNCGQEFTVVVDYAHTHDALEKALHAARSLTRNRVIVVFGCGGDRDRGKRADMGRVAVTLSDHAIVTSDNPRNEDPRQIIDDVLKGFPTEMQEGQDYVIEPNRRDAIQQAIRMARIGDLVLIAGKGHETYQILKTGTIPFDDRAVATEFLMLRSNLD